MSHKRADIKESSLKTKFNIFNKHIFPTFEEVPIDSITDDDIANWQKKMKLCIQPNGKHFSEAYLRTIQSQFNSIINYAFSKGYLKANPLADIKNMGIKDNQVEFWTPEEYERFAYYAMEYPQYCYVYEVLYYTADEPFHTGRGSLWCTEGRLCFSQIFNQRKTQGTNAVFIAQLCI